MCVLTEGVVLVFIVDGAVVESVHQPTDTTSSAADNTTTLMSFAACLLVHVGAQDSRAQRVSCCGCQEGTETTASHQERVWKVTVSWVMLWKVTVSWCPQAGPLDLDLHLPRSAALDPGIGRPLLVSCDNNAVFAAF